MYRKFFKQSDPFYSIYGVGSYTLAEWKVVWPELGKTVQAAVCGPAQIAGRLKPVVPAHTIVLIACGGEREAHFICALLNSGPSQCAIRGYVALHPSPHVLEYIRIPGFKSGNDRHERLVTLSMECHEAVGSGESERRQKGEREIDQLAAEVWNISKEELAGIQRSLDLLGWNN
jgi:hypothetical protein